MKITDFPVCTPYQRKSRIYHATRGHTGTDHLFNYHTLESPVNGIVVRIADQPEMGKCLYLKDEKGNIHVFAHLYKAYVLKGSRVRKGNIIVQCGNTGTVSSQPHLHYEIITPKPLNPEDKIMVRKLWEFSGYNTDPIKYLASLELNTPDWIGKLAKAPDWILAKVKKIPFPKWLNSVAIHVLALGGCRKRGNRFELWLCSRGRALVGLSVYQRCFQARKLRMYAVTCVA